MVDDEAVLLTRSERRLALGGIVGVGGFIAAWVACGAVRSGYSPLHDAISVLAESGTPRRWWMTGGFVLLGLGVSAYSVALRSALDNSAWVTALITGLATLGVAAAPLGVADRLHGIFAVTSYITLAATPILAASIFRAQGRDRWANVSMVCGIATAVALTISITGPLYGGFQRLGFTITDAWIVATAWVMWRKGRLA